MGLHVVFENSVGSSMQWDCMDGQVSAGGCVVVFTSKMDAKAGLILNSCVFLAAFPAIPLYFLFHLSLFLQSHFSKFLCAISWTGFIYLAGGRFAFSKFMCLLST